jgi:hypothetical protein
MLSIGGFSTLLQSTPLRRWKKKKKKKKVGLKLNDTHQLLTYADVNLLVDNTTPMKGNTEALTNASMEIDQEVNM